MDARQIGARIQALRRQKNLKRAELAERLGVDISWITKIENGQANPTLKKLLAIANALGEELYSVCSVESLVAFRQVREGRVDYGSGSDSFERTAYFENPLSLGPGNELSEIPPSDYLPFLKKLLPRGYKSDPDRIIAFPTAGVSMRPTINPGSIVWIDRKDIEPREGQIYAFWLADRQAVTVKRLIKIGKRFCIIDGDNHNEEERKLEELRDFPMVIDCREHEAQGEPWPIRGRVIWILNRLIEEPKK